MEIFYGKFKIPRHIKNPHKILEITFQQREMFVVTISEVKSHNGQRHRRFFIVLTNSVKFLIKAQTR